MRWFSYKKNIDKLVQDQFYNLLKIINVINLAMLTKLDGVGPIDNRPSTDKLIHFVQKKKKKEKKLHVTRDMWNVTRDMWHVTHDTFGGVNILSKFQLPSSCRLWFMILWRSGGKGLINEWMN